MQHGLASLSFSRHVDLREGPLMPADAWILLVVSVGLGLGLELAYMRVRLQERRERRDRGPR